jgi:hypothetical protein
VYANFFSVRVVNTWNTIPDMIKMAKNPGQFKRLYKAHRCSLGGEWGDLEENEMDDYPEKRADGPHNAPRWPDEDPSTSKTK